MGDEGIKKAQKINHITFENVIQQRASAESVQNKGKMLWT